MMVSGGCKFSGIFSAGSKGGLGSCNSTARFFKPVLILCLGLIELLLLLVYLLVRNTRVDITLAGIAYPIVKSEVYGFTG